MSDIVTGVAAVYEGSPRQLSLQSFPVVAPEAGAMVVKTRIASICGSDIHQWAGNFDFRAHARPLPQILGHEVIGEIFRIGGSVADSLTGEPLDVGDRVVVRPFYPCGQCNSCRSGRTRACPDARAYLRQSCTVAPHFRGSFAEYMHVFPGATVVKVPDSVSDELAANANCAVSQMMAAVDVAQLSEADTLVVQGCGGLGLYGVAIAKSLGVKTIIAVDSVAARLTLASRLGATAVINIEDDSNSAKRIERIRELTAGWGPDVVFEVSGNPIAVQEGLQMLGRAGRYIEIGNILGGKSIEVSPSRLVFNNQSIYGLLYYDPGHLCKAIEWLEKHGEALPVNQFHPTAFRLNEVNEAFVAAESRAAPRVCIKFGDRADGRRET